MANEFGIRYDLSKDLLVYENFEEMPLSDGSQRLKIMSLLLIIPEFFTPELLIMHSLPIYPEVSYLQDIKMSKYRWEKIEKIVTIEVQRVIRVPIAADIEEVTHFIGNQIFNFISKIRYPIFIYRTILENLVFTWQGTINSKETYLKALRNGNLSVEVKFYIVCKSFMHEKLIKKYFRGLNEEMIMANLLEDPIVEEYIPVYFWLCRFTGSRKNIETTLYPNPEGEPTVISFASDYYASPLDYLFMWASFTFNDTAFKFIWEKFTSHAIDRGNNFDLMHSTMIGDHRMANIVIFLLSKISEQEFGYFIGNRSNIIFEYLLQLRWQGSFAKILNVLHSHFDNETYIKIFEFMISEICSPRKDKVSRRVLQEFLEKMPFAAKRQFLQGYDFLYYKLFQKFYKNKDLESCSLLLEICGPLNANNLFSTNLGKIFFDKHIYDLKFEAINDILRQSWTTLRPVNAIKAKFFKERAFHHCHRFILHKELENLNLFINWCLSFISMKDVLLLRADILLLEDGKLLKELLFKNLKTDVFQYVDKILEWCLGQQNLITHLKSSIIMVNESENHEGDTDSQKINIYTEIKNCIEKFQFRFLHQLFKWKPCSEEEIMEIKNSLLNDDKIYRIIFPERNVLSFFSPFYCFATELQLQIPNP